MKRPHAVTPELVRRVLLCLAGDEVRIARGATEDAHPLTVGVLRDHCASPAFLKSIAREASNGARVLEVERAVEAHLRAPRRGRP